jgi:hypothetical protein
MPLRLVDIASLPSVGHVGPGNWLEPKRRVFVNSAAFQMIKRDLRRYVDGEIPGRSHLIAGHRGAGKTALVLRAAEDLRFDILNGLPATQRPPLVKLHGPSLFSGDLPATAKDDTPAKGDKLGAALAQITVALYRALAQEFAYAFRRQVMLGSGTPPDQRQLELAAALTLELDNGSTATVLRAFWVKINRLAPGVLWPADWPAVRPDQGMREIVALATASQAFQVCIGAIDFKTTTSNSDTGKNKTKTGLSFDAASLINRLAGLLGGAVFGAGLAQAGGAHPAVTALAGAAAGLIGAASFSASTSRARDRSQSATYEFIRDFTITTLDRDLPEVIRRLRDAGLTPVFLIDELDKLGVQPAVPNDQAPFSPDPMTSLVDRLKNLTTDYGFFCFLTNRDYFEALRARLRDGAFPREHTYFSEQHFVLCTATDQLRYVLQAIECTLGTEDEDAASHWMALAFATRLRSRMNIIALVREMNRHVDSAGLVLPEFRAMATLPRYQIATAIQLAIDLALAAPKLQARIDDDPLFAQLAVDALYRLPTALEAGDPDVSLTETDLTAYLRTRSAGSPTGRAAIDQISPADRAALAFVTTEMGRRLTDFTALAAIVYWTPERQKSVLPEGGTSAVEKRAVQSFASILPVPTQAAMGLLREDAPGHFLFLLDRFGNPRAPAASQPDQAAAQSRQNDLMQAARALIGYPLNPSSPAAPNALQAYGYRTPDGPGAPSPGALPRLLVTVAYLKQLGVLGAGVPDETAIATALASTEAPGFTSAAGGSDLIAQLESFVESCAQASRMIAWAALITRTIAAEAENLALRRADITLRPYNDDAVRVGIARHVSLSQPPGADAPTTINGALANTCVHFLHDDASRLLPQITGLNARGVQTWLDEAINLPSLMIVPESPGADPWDYWRNPVAAFFTLIPVTPEPMPPLQLVLSARGVPPACIFRQDLAAMTALEWSELAIRAVGEATNKANGGSRSWVILAALRALGFGVATLWSAKQTWGGLVDGPKEPDFLANWDGASPSIHLLYIVDSAGRTVADEPPSRSNQAVLAVRRRDLSASKPLLDFLDSALQLPMARVLI